MVNAHVAATGGAEVPLPGRASALCAKTRGAHSSWRPQPRAGRAPGCNASRAVDVVHERSDGSVGGCRPHCGGRDWETGDRTDEKRAQILPLVYTAFDNPRKGTGEVLIAK